MTKFEWEHSLNKYLSELPNDERQKIMDYYRELFDDKFERGESEYSIVQSFGNPAEVAMEILRSFDIQNQNASRGYPPRNTPGSGGHTPYANVNPVPQNIYAYGDTVTPQTNPYAKTAGQNSNGTRATAPANEQYINNGTSGVVMPQPNPYATSYNATQAPQANSYPFTPKVNPYKKSESVAQAPQKKQTTLTGVLAATLRVIIYISLGIAAFTVWVTLGSVLVSTAIAAGGSIIAAIMSVFSALPTAQKMVAFGISILAAGIMILLCMVSLKLLKLSKKLSKSITEKTKSLTCGEKEQH